MVTPFNFAALPRIIFGTGRLRDLPALVKSFGKNVVLVTGKKSFAETRAAELMFQQFRDESIRFHHIVISGEPSPDNIDRAVESLSEQEFDCVSGIGGGSVLDAAKAISAMIYRKESVAEFLEGVGNREHPGTKLPFIAVPTTSGTGSEATKNAVLSQVGSPGFKRSLRHENFVPDIALVDPGLTLSCPSDITAASGMDCFSQLTEAYLSTKSNVWTDALALEGLKQIKVSLLRSCTHGSDIQARTGMSFAALTSGVCLANGGLGTVHGFASSIGARYNIPHGVICGTLMASANELTVRKLRQESGNPEALSKYALLGHLFLGENNKTDDYNIDGFIGYLKELTCDLKLPTLSDSGIMDFNLADIANDTDNKNNPVKLSSGDLLEILKGRY
jgi:alcohol dehydrogenase class IV